MDKLKRFLAPPVFADDAEKTRVAYLLNVMVLTIISAFSVVSLLLAFNPVTRRGLIVLIPLSLFAWGAWALLRMGHVYGTAHGFVLFLWVAITCIIFFAGGVRSPETGGYVLVLIIAGMLGGIRMLFLFTGVSLVSVLGMYGLERMGLLPLPLFPPGPLGGLVMSLLNSLLVCIVFYMALSSLQHAMAAARYSGQELVNKNRALETARASLEEQVVARTQAAEEARLEAEAATTALQEQMWQVLGLAQLRELHPAAPGIAPLATAALEHVCRYVDAAVGALYLRENVSLVLTATYACPGALPRDSRFALGEGVIGQVAAEGRPHVLAATPALTLHSSFGAITLAQVHVYPLIYGAVTIGVLEIGRVTPFTSAQIRFLTQALERLAGLIHDFQAQTRINLLLQEMQQQAEELRAHEEELRTTNEELQAQTEALRGQPGHAK
ncbi:MAG TPA: GAF domain-containing protein [Anaerolineae bacterium]|nr:GAF domain-containing protein [Anaerolineae bacterium]